MDDILVIGAGIIGISTALELQRRGRRVRVLDRTGVAAETSQGNAGAFAFAEIEPLAMPGIMRKAPKWLLDPLGPLSIPPQYALNIAPWMLRFWRSSWPDRYREALGAQARLMALSSDALNRQISYTKGADLIRDEGQLQLYEGEKQFLSNAKAMALRREHGIDLEVLESREAIASVQPGLASRFTHGVFTPGWRNTVDPKIWTEHLANYFRNGGGIIDRAQVKSLRQTADGLEVDTDTGVISASQVVVAAGAWSHHLARTLGDKLPLETERGYNTTLPAGAFDIRTHLTFGGHGFVVTRIGDGVRVGGAVELGGLKLPPNYKRAQVLLDKAARFLPGLKTEGGTQWMGFRPSMPDSLPVIGASPKADKVIYGFGHGHLGLTQSSGTAELVAALSCAETPPIPLARYAPDRF